MALDEELFGIERGFWTEGEDYFLRHVDEACLLAFPQAGEMTGIHSREDVAATATQANRWRDLDMAERHMLRIGDDAALVNYKAKVTRFDGMPYQALVSSAYVRRGNGWKLAFHQHSPVEKGKGGGD
jgi:PAS domain-containing protein